MLEKKHITLLNYLYLFTERRCGDDDVCDEPLFSDVDEALFEVPTIKALMALHDNYIPVRMILLCRAVGMYFLAL